MIDGTCLDVGDLVGEAPDQSWQDWRRFSCPLTLDTCSQGGREKAPAAFCRKAICSTKEFEMWGDGEQTRSFMFIEDCVEGSIRIMEGDYDLPLNLGTEEMVRQEMP